MSNSDPQVAPRPALAEVPTPPWKPASMFWVAFFGGPLAVTYTFFVNARRLRARRHLVAALGVSCVAINAAMFALIDLRGGPKFLHRLCTFAIACVLFILLRSIQVDADRRYRAQAAPYGPLWWKPGLFIVILGGLTSAAINFWTSHIVMRLL